MDRKVVFALLIVGAMLMASCSKDPFEFSIYDEQPEIVTYQAYLDASTGLPEAGTGPVLNFGTEKGIIEKRGLQFKDSDGDGELDDYEDWRLTPRERATDLVNQMSPELRLSFLNWNAQWFGQIQTDAEGNATYGIPGLESDGSITVETGAGTATLAKSIVTDFQRYSNSGYGTDPVDQVKYLNNVQGLTERMEWGIPFFVTTPPNHDQWFGNELDVSKRSMWPYLMGLGAINDRAVSTAFGETVGEEVRMRGAHAVWGPQADIATEPRWARIQHAIHADANIAAMHIGTIVEAIQGGTNLQPEAAAAFIKHFPGSGNVEEGMDSHTFAGRYNVYPGNNFEDHLIPFQAAIDAGVAGVMTLYSIVDIDEYKDVEDGQMVDEGAAFSTKIINDLLKEQMGFDGAIVTDQLNGPLISWGHQEDSMEEILAELLNAGVYQYLPGDLESWKLAYENGLIEDETIINAVIHTVELQFELGLFENPYVDIAEAEAFWNPEGPVMQRRVAAGILAQKKAVVLAKNDQISPSLDVLPIQGNNAEYIAAMDTNGNGRIDVYFDSTFDGADSGEAATYATHDNGKYLATNFVADIADADIAVVRMYARGATYFGTQGGVPLDFSTPARVWDRDAQEYTSEEIENFMDFGSWTFGDTSDVSRVLGVAGGSYRGYLGYSDSMAQIERALAAQAANPNLKIVVGMTATRPGIVTEFIDDIDAFLIDFAAIDDAFLDVVFNQEGFSPKATLPVEFPRDNASVEAQMEDVAGDTVDPLYEIGFGLRFRSTGYGN